MIRVRLSSLEGVGTEEVKASTLVDKARTDGTANFITTLLVCVFIYSENKNSVTYSTFAFL